MRPAKGGGGGGGGGFTPMLRFWSGGVGGWAGLSVKPRGGGEGVDGRDQPGHDVDREGVGSLMVGGGTKGRRGWPGQARP